MMVLLRQFNLAELCRYGISGAMVVAIDYLMFAALLQLMPEHYLLANQAGKAASALAGFFLHRHFSFAGNHRHVGSAQFSMYAALFGFNLASSSLLLWLLVGQFGMFAYFGKIAADTVVIATSFLTGKFLIYRHVVQE